ncbi:T9SS type A sorting domain-containing protein [Pedobacter sp.]|uniref:T9SS type A sorting domain-containing protein n=1 Tax=Pedobacter sp. TaxID=1411316 RepID=UPI0031D97A87
MKKFLLSLLFISGFVAKTLSQTIITNLSPIQQDFNGLSNTSNQTWTNNTTISGWYSNKTDLTINTGSSNVGALYNYGSSNSTDRALGGLAAGTIGTIYYGWLLTNNTGNEIKSVTISYNGEQWRSGGTNSTLQSLTFQYQLGTSLSDITTGTWTSVPSLKFDSKINSSTAGALDGNASANRTSITASFNVLIGPNEQIFIRWTDIDDSNNDHGLAIDDVIFTPNASVLPVSLTSFTAKANQQNVDLAWNTASEKDNSHFDILRSGDGKTFSKIGEVKGAGNSSTAKNYAFTDKDALPGVSYYQLKQFDADGKSSDSEVIAVKSNVAASNFRVFANKQEGIVKLTIFAANEGKGSFKIYDLNGRKLTEQQLNLSKGYTNVSVPFSGANGLHVASLTTATETVTQKFIQ